MSLPSGYKRLEYIKSSGTQYIDTGFQPNQDTRVVMDVQYIGTGSTSQWFFGCRGSRSTKYDFCVYNSKTVFYDTYSSKNVTYNVSDARHLIDKNKNVTSIDGSIVNTFSAATFSTGKNLYLLGLNNAGSLTRPAPAKLYSCQIYDNGTMIRDYIPCQTVAGDIGLWDDVNSVFYGNAGKRTFTAGPVIAIAADKSKIKKLEYIQSSGTQWTDTGFKPTGATKVVIDFQMVSQGSSQQGVFGSRPGTSGRFTVFTGQNGASDLQVDYNTEQTLASVGSSITGLNVNSRTTLEVSNSLVINGTTVKTVSVASFTSTYNLFLFANNNAGTAQLPGILKLYSCQIYNNGTLIRDYIPCQTASGEIGLWDDVNSLFYGNAGTGMFTAGPVIAISVALSDIRELEYIESSGTQFIDTGVVPKNNTRVDVDCDITYGTGWIMILGSYDTNKYFSWWANGATIYAYYGTSNNNVAGENGKQTLSANKNIWSAGNSAMSFSEVSFTANSSIYLFSVNNGGNYSKASMKVYSCQIYDDGTLIRDYIPAKLSDDTVGLYDKLNGLLYINAGTGTFEAGTNSLNLPVNIGGTWKDANEAFVNIGGTWKTVEAAFVNIGGTWKELG